MQKRYSEGGKTISWVSPLTGKGSSSLDMTKPLFEKCLSLNKDKFV